MIKIFAEPLGALLKFIYNMVEFLDTPTLSAYAMSIIITTIIFKLMLLPLTLKQTKSMKDMQTIQPKLKKLQEKYKNDKETLNVKTMELYKEHNVNPFGGCLPLIIQMPIIIAFFQVLRDPTKYVFENKEAFDALNKSFLWIKDLGFAENSVIDGAYNGIKLLGENSIPLLGSMLAAIPVLAILAGITTWLTSKMTSMNQAGGDQKTASTQNTMTMMMPIMIFFFALNFPAGLTLYWVIGNLFQLAQQYFINRSTGDIKGA